MKKIQANTGRPDVVAAVRGGDWSQAMDGEGAPGDATLEHALYWRQIYTEILAMEEKVLDRIRQLMNTQSEEGRREVELTNVPVVVAQAERFRQRLGYWEIRYPSSTALSPQTLARRRGGFMPHFCGFCYAYSPR